MSGSSKVDVSPSDTTSSGAAADEVVSGVITGTHKPSTSRHISAYYIPPARPNRILTLPAEVTCRILELVDGLWIEYMTVHYAMAGPDHPDPPPRPGFLFLQVCRKWRQDALGYKRLWATFIHTVPNKVVSLPLLSFYLKQSGPVPLDIVIRAQNFYWVEGQDEDGKFYDDEQIKDDHEDSQYSLEPWTNCIFGQLVDTLAAHAHRWRSLALDICIGNFDTATLLPVQTAHAPLLTVLEILLYNQWRRETLKSLGNLRGQLAIVLRGDKPDPQAGRQHIHVSERLAAVRLDILSLYTVTVAPSFSHLTVLELRNSHYIHIPRMAYSNIFNNAPCLVSATFMRCHMYEEEDEDGELVAEYNHDGDDDDSEALIMHAPSLQVLRSFTSDMSKYMWDYLRAPQLKDIVIASEPLNRMCFWLTHDGDETPFPSLERLVLEDCNLDFDVTVGGLLHIAQLTQTIEELVLIRDTTVLNLMVAAGRNQDLWPNLRVLKFQRSSSPRRGADLNEHHGDVKDLARVVKWRQRMFGIPCVIEVDDDYFPPDMLHADLDSNETQLSEEAHKDAVELNALIAKGTVKLVPGRSQRAPPVWPPPAGLERPSSVHDLAHVPMLGALNNPWY